MRKRWLQLCVFLLIITGITPFGCAHKPDGGQAQTITDSGPRDKETLLALETDKVAGEARSPSRTRLPGLQEDINVFVNENITFGYNAYAISSAAQEILNTKAAFLTANPSLIVRIEGHCDERGTVDYNLALGDRRAKAARDYLCALGIAPERIQTISYGAERPLDPGHSEEAWAINRRDRFIILNP